MKRLLHIKQVRTPLEYILCVIVCFVSMWYVLRLNLFDIYIPYVYTGDGLSTNLFIKGMIDNGWYNFNPYVGAPFGLEMYDYPLGGDNFQYLVMKFLSLFNSNSIWVMNVYYLMTFPLCMISAYMVFRNFKVPISFSITFSLLYAFLPYHILRTGHLFLLGYYMIPLMVMVIMWLAHQDDFLLVKSRENPKTRGYRINVNKKLFASFIICALIGATGAYYAFFSCFFLAVVGIAQWIFEKNAAKFFKSLFLVLIIVFSLAVNISPSLYYKLNNPSQNSVSSRDFEAAEIYGLKISQLLLPTTNHNMEWIRDKKNEYNSKAPLVNENDTASLGVIGSFGFLMLLIVMIFLKMRPDLNNQYVRTLSIMNVCALLLGTIGGFGVLFAALISAQIRSYNRLSIFIAFFSLLYLALSTKLIIKKFKLNNYVVSLIALIVAFVGMFDQSSHPLVSSKIVAQKYNQDAEFIHHIRELVPSKSMIFQVPYVSFPEGEKLNNMGNYDLLKGYIHSHDLYWSFGNMKSSFGDRWMKALVKRPLNEAINIISYTGYTGIYIDRNGYTPDYLKQLEATLKNLTGKDPIESYDKTSAFYDLRSYSEKLKSKLTDSQWEKKKNEYLSRINYGKEIIIQGQENWSLLQNNQGYKVLQTDQIKYLPMEQQEIEVINSKGEKLTFNDDFLASNQFSSRHWEHPNHFLISVSNAASGWNDSYSPTDKEISEFFSRNKYYIYYTPNSKQLSFDEQSHS
ncbi:hypothetical protein [Paenibacillus sp. 1-18]|uniref:hypothetical protein n=1 Tax=Paenibacillus sp. 1-18 TaxID=1333846 RepID=UPI00046F7BBF|nr:hypothetical protein [Paenibacillus sp. 1-18]